MTILKRYHNGKTWIFLGVLKIPFLEIWVFIILKTVCRLFLDRHQRGHDNDLRQASTSIVKSVFLKSFQLFSRSSSAERLSTTETKNQDQRQISVNLWRYTTGGKSNCNAQNQLLVLAQYYTMWTWPIGLKPGWFNWACRVVLNITYYFWNV